ARGLQVALITSDLSQIIERSCDAGHILPVPLDRQALFEAAARGPIVCLCELHTTQVVERKRLALFVSQTAPEGKALFEQYLCRRIVILTQGQDARAIQRFCTRGTILRRCRRRERRLQPLPPFTQMAAHFPEPPEGARKAQSILRSATGLAPFQGSSQVV